MSLFTTRQLIAATQEKLKFRALFLELFFPREIVFDTEDVQLDKITGRAPIALSLVMLSPSTRSPRQW
jgi:hypothetical protein